MTVSAKTLSRDVPVWRMAPSLRRLGARPGARPSLDPAWPCLQSGAPAGESLIARLDTALVALDGVIRCTPPLGAPGRGFGLDDALARGQPEAFLAAPCVLNLRPDGSLHLGLRPELAQKVVDRGWATVHPFVRYMAGALPPQSLVVYAPRTEGECAIAQKIAIAAYGYALGRIGDVVLPDTRW